MRNRTRRSFYVHLASGFDRLLANLDAFDPTLDIREQRNGRTRERDFLFVRNPAPISTRLLLCVNINENPVIE
jgi:hypothetical protein